MFQSATSAANRHGSARAQASRKNNGVPVGAESICAAVWVTPYCYDRRETRAPARTNAIALRRNLLCLRPADSKGPRLQPLYRAAARAAAGVTRPTLGASPDHQPGPRHEGARDRPLVQRQERRPATSLARPRPCNVLRRGSCRDHANRLLLSWSGFTWRRPAAASGMRATVAPVAAPSFRRRRADLARRFLCNPPLSTRAPPAIPLEDPRRLARVPAGHFRWRTTHWERTNPWFAVELLPELRARIAAALQ
jgi:hypothetical protein